VSLAGQVVLLGGVGVLSAVLVGAKLRWGIPGHLAILWLTPLLVGRFLAPLGAAATVASTTTALGLYAFGGLSPRWPVVADVATFWAVGPVLDICVLLARAPRGGAERRGTPWAAVRLAAWAAVAGVVGNLAHLGSKVLLGVIGPHRPGWGLPSGVYEVVTYAVFGAAAGLVACGAARLVRGSGAAR
jgi:hypothetical protein